MNGQNLTVVYVVAGGTLVAKTADEPFILLEDMTSNNYQWPIEWSLAKKAVELYEVDQFTALFV